MKTARVKLFRLTPPFLKTVTIGQITVGGFIDLVRMIIRRSAEIHLTLGQAVDETAFLAAGWSGEMSAFADSIAVNQPAGFLEDWCSGPCAKRNLAAFLAASRRAEGPGGWTRIYGTINVPGTQRPERQGSIMGDVQAISQIFGGIDPTAVFSWPMQTFLDVCDGLNMQMKRAEDEANRPMSIAVLGTMPGVEVIH